MFNKAHSLQVDMKSFLRHSPETPGLRMELNRPDLIPHHSNRIGKSNPIPLPSKFVTLPSRISGCKKCKYVDGGIYAEGERNNHEDRHNELKSC